MKLIITGGSGFIGTNFITEVLALNDLQVLNLDIVKPKLELYSQYWLQCDILDCNKLSGIFSSFKPDIVVHLAARADVDGKTLDDYKVNIEGTQNVLEAIKKTSNIKRVIITSTQFVNQYNGTPKSDEDFAPHTIYGESKVITEKLTREANLECVWSIIRPTNIWGPWHWRYPFEFWKVISDGKYLHPKGHQVTRSYGFVGNIVWQILRLLEVEDERINKQVFYVGDKPIDILDWVNGFSNLLIGRNVHLVPAFFVKSLAIFGDLMNYLGIRFPITSSRFKSMTTSNDAPMKKTFEVLGNPPYSLNEGISCTVDWLKIYYPKLVKVN